MTFSSASSNRTCPVCGARNSGISLFCAECGSSLNSDVDRTGDTAAIPARAPASQHTEPFSPARGGTSGTRRWRSGEDQRQDETAPFRSAPGTQTATAPSSDRWTTSSNGAVTRVFPVDPPRHDDRSVPVKMVEHQGPGARGFFLGLLACILIAIIVTLYGWTAWLSADLRDTISGWFGFIG